MSKIKCLGIVSDTGLDSSFDAISESLGEITQKKQAIEAALRVHRELHQELQDLKRSVSPNPDTYIDEEYITPKYNYNEEKGFELADGQGFMLPSRSANIIAGMGKAYNAGVIFKPAHYEVVERIVKPESVDENGKIIPAVTAFVPVMMKYSSVVLTDKITERFPKLKALRDAMERGDENGKPIDEYIFDSVNKVGQPVGARPSPIHNSQTADIVIIPQNSIISLSNENFRLQLNPKHDPYSTVPNPTQMGYFLNVLGRIFPQAGAVNDPAASEVYSSMAALITHGLKKTTAALTDTGRISKAQIKKSLAGPGNERISEMLDTLGYNMPNIADKALIQIMNLFSKDTVKVKFKGGKFVLQSAYGFEMIKPGSQREQALTEEQRIKHDSVWSAFGQEARQKIADQARNLQYGTDSKGGMYAEVLIDRKFANKIKAGQFILPDGMGYRIPSTELHSAIAIRVAGYYDSDEAEGSNVIVAPPELVKQHGSDFDVDALYVIGRETYNKDLVIGGETVYKAAITQEEVDTPGKAIIPAYEWNSGLGKYTYNKKNWESKFPKWYKKAGRDAALIAQIDEIYAMFHRNNIVENFMTVISHPENVKRMTEPISTRVIDDVIKDLKLTDKPNVDLSHPVHNLDVYNSNFQGAKLVGTFANGMKALAYMLKSGPNGDYPTLKEVATDVPFKITIGPNSYSSFTEQASDGNTAWQVLDALVNTSLDNVKDQKLAKINATDFTGNMYIAGKALGIPLNDFVRFMLQPMAKMFSAKSGELNNVKQEIVRAYNALSSEAQVGSFADLSKLSTAIEMPSLDELKDKTSKEIKDLTREELIQQAKLVPEFEELRKLGNEISTFSRAIAIVQDFPVDYEEIQAIEDHWAEMGTVEGDKFTTHPTFGLNLDNLFIAQPNIKEAYHAFQIAKKRAETSLTKHLPAVRVFVDQIIRESGVRMSFKSNVSDIKNELITYLISSMYSEENKAELPIKYDYKNKERVATGKAAWSQRFITKVEEAKEKLRAAKVADPELETNSFLNKIGVNTKYGLKTLTFAASSNSDYLDNLDMQEAFSQLESEELKLGFVKYAIMNYGLKFGVKNYSLFIPVDYLKPVDKYLTEIGERLRKNETKIVQNGVIKEAVVVSGELANIKDNFMIKLAINNADKLPFISTKGENGISPIPTEGKTVSVGGETYPALTGFDEYFYHRKYANPVNETGKRRFAEENFPMFIRTGENIALMRVNDVNNDFVYYQRLGMKNWAGGYDAPIEALKGGYDIQRYFDKWLIPVPTGDINQKEIEVVGNDYIEEGSRVIIYGYSNETRDQGIFGIVDKIKKGMDDTRPSSTITIKAIPQELTETQKAFRAQFNPTIQLLKDRFKVPVYLVSADQMPEGYSKNKGLLHNGEIYLNLDEMDWDTPFHEIAHPLIHEIKKRNPKWYQELLTQVNESEKGQEVIEQVNALYPNLTPEQKEVESMVTLLGLLAANKLNNPDNLTLKGLVMRLGRAIADVIRSILKSAGVINLDMLSRDSMSEVTLTDLADLLASKDANITLDLGASAREVGLAESKAAEEAPEEETPAEEAELKEEEKKVTGPHEKVMNDILEQAKFIVAPVEDANGNQASTYGIADIAGGVATRFVTRVSNLLSAFSLRKGEQVDKNGKPFESTEDAIIYRETNKLFQNVPTGGTASYEGVEYTREEFADAKRRFFKQGLVKGNLIHALLHQQTTRLNGDEVTAQRLQRKINALESESSVPAGQYNWVTTAKTFQAIMRNAGIYIGKDIPVGLQDKVHAEVSVYSPEMGVVGTIDTLVRKANGKLKVVDYKSGSRLSDGILYSRILAYGSQEISIYDNAMGRSKLQAMIYSLIIKASNPDALFEPPVIMHVPNEERAEDPTNAHHVEVRDYLKMIEQYYKNEEPAIYKAMLAKSPKIFNPSEYGASENTSFTQDMIDKKTGLRDIEQLNMYQIQLEQLVTRMAIEQQKPGSYSGTWNAEQLKTRDSLMRKIAQARSTLRLPTGTTKDYEVHLITKWLGTINDTNNPYIQAYAQIVNQARLEVYAEYSQVEAEFDSKMLKVKEEKLGKDTGVKRALSAVDKAKLFADLIHEEVETDQDGQRRVNRGLIQPTNPKWSTLTAAQQDLATFMSTKMKEIFHEVLVDGPGAVVSETKAGRKITKLDIYNNTRNFKWSDNFIPKMAITSSEVRYDAVRRGLPGIGMYLRHEVAKRLSMFYEENIEGDNQEQYGIPIKYLGSGTSLHNPDFHTSNLELAFKGFMQHMINKKHYDSVYAMGDSIKEFLGDQKQNGVKVNKGASEFLGYHMHRNLVGRITKKDDDLTRKPLTLWRLSEGDNIKFSTYKAFKTLGAVTAASALWLKFPSAAKNAMQAMWAVSKESMINSMDDKWNGLTIDNKDLSLATHAKAYGQWMSFQKDSMLGKGEAHPVHVFMKAFRMYPDSTETMGVYGRKMIADGGTAYNFSHLSMLYSYPEAMTAAVIAMDAMMAMKIESGPYKGQSMWDVYSKSVVTDPVTGEGKFTLPADFTRGKLRMGDGTVQELRGLNFLEIQKIHRIIQRVKGGYRPEERSMIESSSLGEAFMLFKRWLPATIIQAGKSKYYDQSMGYLAKTDNEDEYEWRARLNEGRFRTLAGFVANAGGSVFGKPQRNGYNWEDLSDLQRRNLLDTGYSLGMWALFAVVLGAAMGGSDDEDSFKKFAHEANMRMIEHINPFAIIDAATSPPAVIKRTLELVTGVKEMSLAGAYYATGAEEEEVFTRRGDLRGLNKVMKNLPFTASYYDAERFIENADYWEQ